MFHLLNQAVPPQGEELPRRAVVGFVVRRVLFYLMVVYFCAATIKFPMLITNLTFWFWAIHILWFEVEVTSRRHSAFATFLHGLSFCGAFDVLALDTILLIYNPGLIETRSQIEHLPVWVMWLLNAQLHWLPVILVSVDLFLNRFSLQRRHDWQVHLHPRKWRLSRVGDVVKILWAAIAAPIVCGVWMALFTVREVYGGDVNLVVMGVVGLIVNALAALVLVFMVARPDPHYDVLINEPY